jgi:hypothetical protein
MYHASDIGSRNDTHRTAAAIVYFDPVDLSASHYRLPSSIVISIRRSTISHYYEEPSYIPLPSGRRKLAESRPSTEVPAIHTPSQSTRESHTIRFPYLDNKSTCRKALSTASERRTRLHSSRSRASSHDAGVHEDNVRVLYGQCMRFIGPCCKTHYGEALEKFVSKKWQISPHTE